jgi:hypothetical protein
MFDYILSGIKNKVFMHTLPIAEKCMQKKRRQPLMPAKPDNIS